jgi:hypothetical protein
VNSNPLHPPPPEGRVELEDWLERLPRAGLPQQRNRVACGRFGYLTPSTLPPEQQFRFGRDRDEPGVLDETDLDRLRHDALNDGQNR